MYFLIGIWGGPRRSTRRSSSSSTRSPASCSCCSPSSGSICNCDPTLPRRRHAGRATPSTCPKLALRRRLGRQGRSRILGLDRGQASSGSRSSSASRSRSRCSRSTPGCPTRTSRRRRRSASSSPACCSRWAPTASCASTSRILPEATQWAAPAMAVFGAINILYGALLRDGAEGPEEARRLLLGQPHGLLPARMAALTPPGIQACIVQMFNHGPITAMLFTPGRRGLRPRAHPRHRQVRRPRLGDAALRRASSASPSWRRSACPGSRGFVGEAARLHRRVPALSRASRCSRRPASSSPPRTTSGRCSACSSAAGTRRGAIASPFRDLTARETLTLVPLAAIVLVLGFWPLPMLVARRPLARRSCCGTCCADARQRAQPGRVRARARARGHAVRRACSSISIVGRLRIGWVAALTIAGVAVAAWLTLATGHAPPRGLFFGLVARDPFGDFWKLLFLGDRGADRARVVARRRRHRRERRRVLRARPGDDDRHDADGVGRRSADRVPVARDGVDHELRARRLPAARAPVGGGGAQVRRLRRRRLGRDALRHVAALRPRRQHQLRRRSCTAAATTPAATTVLLAVVLCLAGFGYKIAAVPFHMWCPDVYEGAPTPVTRVLVRRPQSGRIRPFAAFLRRACCRPSSRGARAPWPLLFGLIAAATMTLGNLAALQQTNLKRLLAYSSIAHAGYVLLGPGRRRPRRRARHPRLPRRLSVHEPRRLHRRSSPSPSVASATSSPPGAASGGARRSPRRRWRCFLLSLTGLPPLSGFFAKFYVFYALVARGGTLHGRARRRRHPQLGACRSTITRAS